MCRSELPGPGASCTMRSSENLSLLIEKQNGFCYVNDRQDNLAVDCNPK